MTAPADIGPPRRARPLLSVIAPMYNEQANVAPFLDAVQSAMGDLDCEIILVDDGSTDATWREIAAGAERDKRVRGLSLSRNFGHQSAIFAGMHAATGRAVVTMDGDLQHPPQLIPQMVEAWKSGAKVVNTHRIDSKDTGVFKRLTSRWFYALFSRLSGVRMAPGSSDFRLLDEQALESLREMSDSDLFIRGMVTWMGYPTVTLPYQVGQRHSGTSKFSLGRMLRFSLAAIFSFSVLPLRLGIWIGFLTSGLTFVEIVYILVQTARGVTIPGWASVMTLLSFMFGVLFLLLGIIGTYLGKIYEIVKRRPRFIVSARAGYGRE